MLLDVPVGKGDLLEARPLADPSQFLTTLAPADAAAGETLRCATARPMPAGSPVRVIRSQAALDDAAQVAGGERPPRRQVAVRVVARRGEPFSVELSCVDGSASACAEGFVVEGARTRAVTREDLVEHVGRMGQSPFAPASFDVELDEGCGMGFSAVHAVRAEACRLLEERLLAPSGRAACERGLARVPDLADIHAQLTFMRERGGVPTRDTRRGASDAEVCALVPTPAVA
ncbi:DUF3656 domain-containing protein, partial [Olsenella massiliensis]|uniref:DUF3656 domain-containing protein n=1 Tax=Olsenella massiliensis TaxID=1622075 RepID=UPI001F352781